MGKPRYLSSPSPRLNLSFTEFSPAPEYEGLYAVRTQLAFPRSSRFDTELLSVLLKVWASPYRYSQVFEVRMLFALAELSCFLCAEGTSASTLPTSGTLYGCKKFFDDPPFSHTLQCLRFQNPGRRSSSNPATHAEIIHKFHASCQLRSDSRSLSGLSVI